ncbi:MAG: MBL fold metallo-hydrolase [Kofleriaceae bacterium]|nr:MBL fold metallo-hydrolase [Kofleriaceae bacterium]
MSTRIDEIADRIYRIHTPIQLSTGGFSFNQYLLVDDEPLLFHTGMKGLFPAVKAAIETVIPFERLRWFGFSHHEADENGALAEMLDAAPHATAVASLVGATISLADSVSRPARPLADGEVLTIGTRQLTWLDAPHLPHAWECGFMFESTTRTLLCGDLFTQPGAQDDPIVETDILGPSEAFRAQMDYFSHSRHTRANLDKLAALAPRTLACMHGSAWTGDGANLLRALADAWDR